MIFSASLESNFPGLSPDIQAGRTIFNFKIKITSDVASRMRRDGVTARKTVIK